jgi:hypothetical protein
MDVTVNTYQTAGADLTYRTTHATCTSRGLRPNQCIFEPPSQVPERASEVALRVSCLVSAWLAGFCLELSLTLKSNELAITPKELKPISAPAIDGVKIVPVTGSNAPAAMGTPTYKINFKIQHNQDKADNAESTHTVELIHSTLFWETSNYLYE